MKVTLFYLAVLSTISDAFVSTSSKSSTFASSLKMSADISEVKVGGKFGSMELRRIDRKVKTNY